MIRKAELLTLQKDLGLPLATLEKDYVLGILIWAIAQYPTLKKTWIFKGGTCLKKCYFGSYRFSEDLDYTLLPEASLDVEVVKDQLAYCFDLVFERFGVRINVSDLVVTAFPDKPELFAQIKIPYQGPLMPSGSLPRIKLDLSREEKLILDPVALPLLHSYSDQDECVTDVMCYSLYEILAEKLRALVQRTRPRDLYDCIHLMDLFVKRDLNKAHLQGVLKKKFAAKSLTYPNDLQHIPENAFLTAKADWEIMLKHQVRNLPPIEHYTHQFSTLLQLLAA